MIEPLAGRTWIIRVCPVIFYAQVASPKGRALNRKTAAKAWTETIFNSISKRKETLDEKQGPFLVEESSTAAKDVWI